MVEAEVDSGDSRSDKIIVMCSLATSLTRLPAHMYVCALLAGGFPVASQRQNRRRGDCFQFAQLTLLFTR